MAAAGHASVHVVLDSQSTDSRVSVDSTVASVQARARLTDRTINKVQLEGKSPFVLHAVVHDDRRRCVAASFLQAHLATRVERLARSSGGLSGSGTMSPLSQVLLKLLKLFAKTFPQVEPEIAQTVMLQVNCSIVLLDVQSGRLHTLCFGKDTQKSDMSGVVSATTGQIADPTSMREYTLRKCPVYETSFDQLQGQHCVVLGSPGVWKYTHPRKAGLQAVAYGSNSALSSSSTVHNSATAVLRSALRTVVAKCVASPSARISCLYSLSQLDRLSPGCKADAPRIRMVPRGRGDIHPDLTASVMSFTLHPVPLLASAPSAGDLSALSPMPSRISSDHSKHADSHMHGLHALDVQPSNSFSLHAISTEHSAHHSTTALSSTPLGSDTQGSPHMSIQSPIQCCSHLTRSPGMHITCSAFCCDAGKHGTRLQHPSMTRVLFESVEGGVSATGKRHLPVSGMAPIEAADSLLDSTKDSSEDAANYLQPFAESATEAQRRWDLLRMHVWVMGQEMRLRKQMWQEAVHAALNPLAPAGSSGATLFSSFELDHGETNSAQGPMQPGAWSADPSVVHA